MLEPTESSVIALAPAPPPPAPPPPLVPLARFFFRRAFPLSLPAPVPAPLRLPPGPYADTCGRLGGCGSNALLAPAVANGLAVDGCCR